MARISGEGARNQRRTKKRLKALAEFVIGEGQQPYESIISAICEAFTCTPDVALVQDLALCRRIFDSRTLEAAKAQHNEDATKMTAHQTQLWMEAMDAANG